MNILIVNENYTRGGLETNLYTQYEAMKDSNKFVYAMGNYNTNLKLGNAKIYEGFHFTPNVTIGQFYEDTKRIVEIIENEKIDVIHAHPFYSVFQAVFAAKLTNIPIAYTLHGVFSVNFPAKINDVILYQAMLESEIDKIYCVSELCVSAVNNATFSNKATLLPNAINTTKFHKNEIVNNKNWALISRVSVDKLKEIKQLISILDKIDIQKLCIYGDGDCKDEVQEYVDSLGLSNKVELMGHYDNLYDELDGKYNGIVGIGRVAMEAICMGYPTLLIGYGKIAGIINKEIFNSIKRNNFINKMLPDIDVVEINKQLLQVYEGNSESKDICNILREEIEATKVYGKYAEELKEIQVYSSFDMKRIFKEISEIQNKNEDFYSSREIYNILRKYIETQCVNMFLKNYFISYNNYFNALDINYNNYMELQKSVANVEANVDADVEAKMLELKQNTNNYIQEQLVELDKKIQEIQDRINIEFLAYNTIQRVKKRKKSQE